MKNESSVQALDEKEESNGYLMGQEGAGSGQVGVVKAAVVPKPALTIKDAYVVSVKNLDFPGDRDRRVVYDEAMIAIGDRVYRLRSAPGVLVPGSTIESADVQGKSGILTLTLITGGPDFGSSQ